MMPPPGAAESRRPLRIEMVLPSLHRGGMEAVAASLGRGLSARGHVVGYTCLGGPGPLADQLSQEGFRVSTVPAPGLLTNAFPRALTDWFRAVRPDLVHAYNGVWLKAAAAATRVRDLRLLFALHGVDASEPWYAPYYNRLAASRTDHVVAVSSSLRSYLLDVVGLSESTVTIVPNGISVQRFRPGKGSAKLRGLLGIPLDRPLIGNVARLEPVKNHRLLINAFSQLRRRRYEAALVLVGDGPLRPELQAQVRELGLTDDVVFTGAVADPAGVLREFDVFALSSHIEAMSVSALEAMATGVPVVATAVGGNPALLRDGRCGLLVPPGDEAALCEAFSKILDDPSLARRLSGLARGAVVAEHSEDSMVSRYEEVYRSVLNSRSPALRPVDPSRRLRERIARRAVRRV